MKEELPQINESEKDLGLEKKKENLTKTLYFLTAYGNMPHWSNAIYELSEADEGELVLEAFNIYLCDCIRIIGDTFEATTITHDPVHAAQSYLRLVEEGTILPTMEGVHVLGKDLLNLYALYSELNGDHQKASHYYEMLGNTDKVNENAAMQDEMSVNPFKIPARKAIWEKAILDFREKAKDLNPFKSKEERDMALEKLKTQIQVKINSLT